MYGAPAFLVVIWAIAWIVVIGCLAASIVELVGQERLARWLRLDIGDER